MGTPWKEKSWKEKKKLFGAGLLVFLCFIGFTYIQTPEYEKQDLTYQTLVLRESPKFIKEHAPRGSVSYSLELNPRRTSLVVKAIDYKYLKHRSFKQEVKKGDTLKIGIIDNIILTMSKDGKEYLQFDRAQYHKQQNRIFSRYLFSTGFILCLLPLLFREHPKFKVDGEIYKFDFAWLFGLGMITCLLILCFTIGYNFVSGAEFID